MLLAVDVVAVDVVVDLAVLGLQLDSMLKVISILNDFLILRVYILLLWELWALASCRPVVNSLVSPETLKLVWFLPLRLLAANFSIWHPTSSSVPPVG